MTIEPSYEKKQQFGFPTKSVKNWPAQSQKYSLLEKKRDLNYLCSENKDADQLGCHCTADLHLFFAYAKSQFSHDAANY